MTFGGAFVALRRGARARRRGGRAGRLSVETDRARRPLPAGRRRRHRRAPGGRCDEPFAQHACGHREQGRRRRRHRHGLCRQGEAGWLHAAARAVVDIDHPRSRQGHRTRARCTSSTSSSAIARFTADPTVLAVRAESPWKTVQEFVADARKPPGRDHVRLVGQLRDDAHPDGDVRGERRRQAAARALHRRRPGGGRAPRRQRRRAIDRPLDRDPARQGGQGAGAGDVGRQAARRRCRTSRR